MSAPRVGWARPPGVSGHGRTFEEIKEHLHEWRVRDGLPSAETWTRFEDWVRHADHRGAKFTRGTAASGRREMLRKGEGFLRFLDRELAAIARTGTRPAVVSFSAVAMRAREHADWREHIFAHTTHADRRETGTIADEWMRSRLLLLAGVLRSAREPSPFFAEISVRAVASVVGSGRAPRRFVRTIGGRTVGGTSSAAVVLRKAKALGWLSLERAAVRGETARTFRVRLPAMLVRKSRGGVS